MDTPTSSGRSKRPRAQGSSDERLRQAHMQKYFKPDRRNLDFDEPPRNANRYDRPPLNNPRMREDQRDYQRNFNQQNRQQNYSSHYRYERNGNGSGRSYGNGYNNNNYRNQRYDRYDRNAGKENFNWRRQNSHEDNNNNQLNLNENQPDNRDVNLNQVAHASSSSSYRFSEALTRSQPQENKKEEVEVMTQKIMLEKLALWIAPNNFPERNFNIADEIINHDAVYNAFMNINKKEKYGFINVGNIIYFKTISGLILLICGDPETKETLIKVSHEYNGGNLVINEFGCKIYEYSELKWQNFTNVISLWFSTTEVDFNYSVAIRKLFKYIKDENFNLWTSLNTAGKHAEFKVKGLGTCISYYVPSDDWRKITNSEKHFKEFNRTIDMSGKSFYISAKAPFLVEASVKDIAFYAAKVAAESLKMSANVKSWNILGRNEGFMRKYTFDWKYHRSLLDKELAPLMTNSTSTFTQELSEKVDDEFDDEMAELEKEEARLKSQYATDPQSSQQVDLSKNLSNQNINPLVKQHSSTPNPVKKTSDLDRTLTPGQSVSSKPSSSGAYNNRI